MLMRRNHPQTERMTKENCGFHWWRTLVPNGSCDGDSLMDILVYSVGRFKLHLTHHFSYITLPCSHQIPEPTPAPTSWAFADHLSNELLRVPARTHHDSFALEDILKEPHSALHEPLLLGRPLANQSGKFWSLERVATGTSQLP